MVDFTQRVNNADMVKGLNDLIHQNMSLMASYERDLLGAVDEEAHRDCIEELKNLHKQHAHLFGDTVRLLGGAPDYSEDRGKWTMKGKMLFSKLQHDHGILDAVYREEEKLEAQYLSKIQSLNASPETVAVINQALEEREGLMRWLQQAIEKEHA